MSWAFGLGIFAAVVFGGHWLLKVACSGISEQDRA